MAGCSSCFPIFREAIAPYIELGFEPKALTDRLVEMQLGAFSFILQAYYVQQWADNFVMHMRVSDVKLWWDSTPPGCFGGSPRRPPRIRTETRRGNEPAD
jgi:hypothetical protein